MLYIYMYILGIYASFTEIHTTSYFPRSMLLQVWIYMAKLVTHI